MSTKSTDVIRVPRLNELDHDLGPAMAALSEKRRKFVLALVAIGGTPAHRAAAMVGYKGDTDTLSVTASRLMADPDVLAALDEESGAKLRSLRLQAVAKLGDLLDDPGTGRKDALAAIRTVLSRTGLPEEKVVVKAKRSNKEQVDRIAAMAKQLGLDPQALLGSAGVVIEGEFKEVKEQIEW